MRHKKSEDSEQNSKQKALEERVDAMMDPKRPDGAVSTPLRIAVNSATSSVPPESAASQVSQATAPPLPGKLSKQLPRYEPAAKPLSIDKLDELTGGVTVIDAETPDMPAATAPGEPRAPESAIDDAGTDKAVEDIVAKEGDLALAVEDAKAARQNSRKSNGGWRSKLKSLCKNKWTWVAIAVLLITVFALPFSRYKILGLVVKKPVTLVVIDDKTRLPVSNAQLVLGSQTGKTDGSGQVELKVPVGSHKLVITKQYYKTTTISYFVGFKPAAVSKIGVVATGRLVPISVTNKITGKPLKGAEIRVLGTTAKTDAQGKATVALPTTSETANATVQLAGYNQSKVDLKVTDQTIKANNFTLTPVGQIYFLSNLNGSIDVVKSNLDGSGRHVVLEGTGKEERNSTSLLASRDWRYLVLKARREGTQPTLYLIDTSNDKVTEFDTTPGTFNLIGWYGHNLIYDLNRSSIQNWQSGQQVLKSYDADHQQLNQFDQSQAEGTANSYANQSFSNFYIVNGAIVYNTAWYGNYSASGQYDISGKTNTIRAVQLPGQAKKDYQPLPSGTTSYLQAALYEPNGIYYEAYNSTDTKRTYYVYEANAVKPASGVDQTDFNRPYPTFLVSPSGNQTFWTDLRDGKNTLFVGDANAKNSKQVASLNDYTPYGWYSDTYTLVAKDDSELYIMAASGLAAGKQPLKVTDYYKPATIYRGYGYGYGGL